MNKCLYLEETNNSDGQDCECTHPDYNGYNCEYCPIFKKDNDMYDKCLEIENLDNLIFVLQDYRECYGNMPVYIQLDGNQTEGCYDIDAVLYTTDENGKKSIDLIVW
jgi:hypothetical protein